MTGELLLTPNGEEVGARGVHPVHCKVEEHLLDGWFP